MKFVCQPININYKSVSKLITKKYALEGTIRQKTDKTYHCAVCVNIESVITRAAPKQVCADFKWNPVRHFNFLPNDTNVFG